MRDVPKVDYVVLNAGILKYPSVSKYAFLFWWLATKMPIGSKITLLPNDLNYREPQKCIRPNAPISSLSLLSSDLANRNINCV